MPKLSLSEIAVEIIKALMVDVGTRETEGENRGPKIDEWNRAIGAVLGSPYCCSGPQYRLKALASTIGCKLVLPYSAGSQDIWQRTLPEYKKAEPSKGRIAMFRSTANPSRGHFATCMGVLKPDGLSFSTIEYNTNAVGSRDGDGVMVGSRKLSGNGNLQLLGFIDLPAMFKPL